MKCTGMHECLHGCQAKYYQVSVPTVGKRRLLVCAWFGGKVLNIGTAFGLKR